MLGDSTEMQVVCVWWGTRYSAEDVNRLTRNVARHASRPVRFVCVCEAVDPAIDATTRQVPFPEFSRPLDEIKQGTRAKLAIFKPGLLDPDLPAVFIDLDTAIFGDVGRLVDEMLRHPEDMHMLGNVLFPLWRFQKWARPLLGDRHYYANSSFMVFQPAHWTWLFDAFNELNARFSGHRPRYLRKTDRFMSHAARDRIRVLPNHLVAKFLEEHMLPVLWAEQVRARLPWVAHRRRNLVAVTFIGDEFSPRALREAKTGQILQRKIYKTRWNYPHYARYWQK